MSTCPRCARPPEVGVLCTSCAVLLAPAEGLLPDHVRSSPVGAAAAWLVDGFGAAHPVGVKTRIGRNPGSALAVLHGSVSRDHAEVVRHGEGWQIRDLGSRNATRLDGRRVEGRAALDHGEIVRIGDVAFLFVARPEAPLVGGDHVLAITQAAGSGTFRAIIRGPHLELCALGALDDAAGGALLHRALGAPQWAETSLPPLEFHLLRALCARALDEPDAPQRSRGAVLSKTLARSLPFQARYANDENVRQVVRRLRTTLQDLGAPDVIETIPGRGYFIAWPVSIA